MRTIVVALGVSACAAATAHGIEPGLTQSNRSKNPLPATADVLFSQPPDLNGFIGASEVIETFGYESEIANDFVVTGGQPPDFTVPITRLRWWGAYFDYSPGDPHVTGFRIRIYRDADCRPGTVVADLTVPYNASETFVAQPGVAPIYEYHVDTRIEVTAGQRYWCSVQATDHPYPPQWGRLSAASVQDCESTFRSDFFGYPAWTAAHIPFGVPYDASQELETAGTVEPDWRQMLVDQNANVRETMELAEEYFAEHDSLLDDEDGVNFYLRWKSFWAGRTDSTGSYRAAKDALYRYLNSAATAQHSPLAAFPAAWQALGPFVEPTRVGSCYATGQGITVALWVDPLNLQTIYLCAGSGGLYKTSNGGITWTNITGAMAGGAPLPQNLAVGDVLKTSSGKLYMATGIGRWQGYGLGLLVSYDDGVSWNTTDLSYSLTVKEDVWGLLTPDPSNESLMYAVSATKVYQTTTGFLSGSSAFVSLTSIPGIPGGVGSGRPHVRPGAAGKDHVYVDGKELWYTSTATQPNNTSWVNLTGLVSSALPGALGVQRIQIAFRNAEPTSVWALVNASNGSFHVVKSTDGGFTWTLLASPTPPGGGRDFAVSPSNPSRMYMGGEAAMYRSTDDGATWIDMSDAYCASWYGFAVHADTWMLNAYQGVSDILFACHDGGISMSPDGGTTWQNLNGAGLDIATFYGIGGAELAPNTIAGGTQDNSIEIYNGAGWVNASQGDGGDCVVDYAYPQTIYGIQNGFIATTEVVKSNNGGVTWFNTLVQPRVAWASDPPPLVQHPTDPNTLWAGYGKLFKTTDAGYSGWLPGASATQSHISALHVNYSDPSVLYFAECCPTYGGLQPKKLYRSNDGGITASDVTPGLSGVAWQGIIGIATDPNDPDRVWVCFRDFWEDPNAPGKSYCRVMHSANGGATWTIYTDGLPDFPANCILYEYGTSDRLYLGTDVGVYYRDAAMPSWQPFKTGMPDMIVVDLEPNYTLNKIRAATHGRGLWESYMAGGGAVSAGGPDGWIMHSDVDIAAEPDVQSGAFLWESPDVWVRNDRDTRFTPAASPPRFLREHQHENPEYAAIPGNQPWVYVKVRNRGNAPLSGTLQLYWARASAGLVWPTNWINDVDPSSGALQGDILGPPGQAAATVTNLLPGAYWVLERQWTDIPDYVTQFGGDDHFCLLARFEGTPGGVDPINNEQLNVAVWQNVSNSNNIGWKNVTLVNNIANNKAGVGQNVMIHNVAGSSAFVTLQFQSADADSTDPYFDHGTMEIDLGDSLFGRWAAEGMQGSGIVVTPDSTLRLIATPASIAALPLNPNERRGIAALFEFDDPGEFDEIHNFTVRMTQYTQGHADPDGGETYVITAGPEALATVPAVEATEIRSLRLLQNAPNPFQDRTGVAFELPRASEVTLEVYGVTGRLAATVIDRKILTAGRHWVEFDGRELASGMYFYRLVARGEGGEQVLKQKMIRLR